LWQAGVGAFFLLTAALARGEFDHLIGVRASPPSECPHTIFSGHISSSLEAKTSRPVETLNHTAMTAAMTGSNNEYPVTLMSTPARTGARDT
jgi:hypothetical protein